MHWNYTKCVTKWLTELMTHKFRDEFRFCLFLYLHAVQIVQYIETTRNALQSDWVTNWLEELCFRHLYQIENVLILTCSPDCTMHWNYTKCVTKWLTELMTHNFRDDLRFGRCSHLHAVHILQCNATKIRINTLQSDWVTNWLEELCFWHLH